MRYKYRVVGWLLEGYARVADFSAPSRAPGRIFGCGPLARRLLANTRMIMDFLTALTVLLCQDPPQQPPPAAKPEEPLIKTAIKQITLGGQIRFRAEYRDPVAYTNLPASLDDDDIYLSRIRLNLRFSVNDDLDVFLQPQDQRTFGDETSVLSDETNLDVHQGYAEMRNLGVEGLTLKVGRQELSYGDQRLVSPLDWSNIARAWDGIKVRYASGAFWVDGFATVIKEGTGAEDDQDFYGLYTSYGGVEAHEFDLYVFGREFNDNSQPSETIPAAVNDRHDFTAGARLKGKAAGFDYTAEGMIQKGKAGDDDVDAWAAALTLGYTFDMDWKPRLGVEVTHASGDEDPTDGAIETFDPLYPFGHFYQGFSDVFSFRNGSDIMISLKVIPVDTLSIQVDAHAFELDQERDAWYNFAGAPIRRDVTGVADKEVGSEIDLHARLSVGKNLKIWAGWSHFFAGPYLEDTPGGDRDMNWFFLQTTVDF